MHEEPQAPRIAAARCSITLRQHWAAWPLPCLCKSLARASRGAGRWHSVLKLQRVRQATWLPAEHTCSTTVERGEALPPATRLRTAAEKEM